MTTIFEPIFSFLNTGSTGVFVSVVLALESFCRERRNSRKKATVEEYLEWLRREDQKELLAAQQDLMKALSAHDENSQVLHEHLRILISQVEAACSSLAHIGEKVSALPRMEQKIDVISEALTSGAEKPPLARGQIAVSARVLEALAASDIGAGIRVTMRHEGNNPQEGTLALRWILGERSPKMMLADYVGDTEGNRLSLILHKDASVSLRAFDANGAQYMITSRSYSEAEAITRVAIWKGQEIALWVNGKCCGRELMKTPFHYLGPVLLYGADIDGVLSADRAQWLDFPRGVAFEKDGICHGSCLDMVVMWSYAHSSDLISDFWQDPWAMLCMRESSERFKPFSEERIQQCTAEIKKGPDFDAYIERANWWFRTGDYTRALADYDAALQLRPHPVIYTYRGEALARLGRYSKALADYNRAIELNPRIADAYDGRASLLATCPDAGIRNGKEAIEDAKKACLLSTDRRDCLETLAAAYAQEGYFDAAIQTQERALALYPHRSTEGRTERITEAEKRLALYRQSRTYSDVSVREHHC